MLSFICFQIYQRGWANRETVSVTVRTHASFSRISLKMIRVLIAFCVSTALPRAQALYRQRIAFLTFASTLAIAVKNEARVAEAAGPKALSTFETRRKARGSHAGDGVGSTRLRRWRSVHATVSALAGWNG